jgi:hypothetical protein
MDDALGKAEIDIQLEERKRRLGLAESSPTIDEEPQEEEESASGT